MEFKKYNKMENSYRTATMEKMINELPLGLNTPCQVTEKVHGANFAFYCDGIEVKVASRNNFVDGVFYNCQSVINMYEDKIMEMHGKFACHEEDPNYELIVYGELAGQGIQKGIEYGEKDFYVFDITVRGQYQRADNVALVTVDCEMNHSPVLCSEITLGEALEYQETFKSVIHEVDGDNFSEGIVIKPITPAFLPNGSRIAIKKKSEKFSEIGGAKVKVAKEVTPMSETDTRMVEDIGLYLTETRLAAVLSKEGIPTQRDYGKISGKLLQDALEDFEGDFDIEVAKLAEDYRRVSKAMQRASMDFIRPFWLDILEGEF